MLSYVWLTGFGYGFARALVREGAPYSNPEPSQTSTWLCPTVNGMYRSSAEVVGVYRKYTNNLSWLRAVQSSELKLDRTQPAEELLHFGMHTINYLHLKNNSLQIN